MAQYDHDFGWSNLTAQASYRSTASDNTSGSFTGFTQDPSLVTAAVLRPPGLGFVRANSDWNAQEVRLTSPGGQTVTYVAGIYHFYEHSYDNHNGSYVVTYPNATGTLGQILLREPLTINGDTVNDLATTDAWAIFGQATWTPIAIPTLHMTGGIRYNEEEKHGSGSIIQNTALNPLSVFDQTAKWKKTTYKLNVAYDITPANMIYVDHSTGFKAGGFAYGRDALYQPENIKSYEIGSKNRFFDNRLQMNLSAWHYDYENIVTTVNEFYFDQTLGRPNGMLNTTNGKSAKVDGATIQFDALLTDKDTLSLNGTWLDARFTDFDASASQKFAMDNGLAPGATPAFFDYSGTPIGNVPDFTGNAIYDHIFYVAGGRLDAQIAARYTGKMVYGNQAARANVNSYIVGDSYMTFDASLRFIPSGRNWSLAGYVRNLTDKDVVVSQGYSSNASFYPMDAPQVFYAYRTKTYGAPRTFGITVSANF
jgi:iron complex outermembrane receptor protein